MVASTSRSFDKIDQSHFSKTATFVRIMSAMQCEVDGDGKGIIRAVEDVRQCQIPYQKTLHMT